MLKKTNRKPRSKKIMITIAFVIALGFGVAGYYLVINKGVDESKDRADTARDEAADRLSSEAFSSVPTSDRSVNFLVSIEDGDIDKAKQVYHDAVAAAEKVEGKYNLASEYAAAAAAVKNKNLEADAYKLKAEVAGVAEEYYIAANKLYSLGKKSESLNLYLRAKKLYSKAPEAKPIVDDIDKRIQEIEK